MDKMTTVQAAKALGITRKALLITLVYHPELCPGAEAGMFNLMQVSQILWSVEEIERVRMHLMTRRRACPPS
ncbi:MAG: hypothetical protein U0350_36520 [Caldilineaceae bacterium]